MINIVKLFNYNTGKSTFNRKLLKLQSHSYTVKLIGVVDKHKVFKYMENLYKNRGIECRLSCSDFMFNEDNVYLKINKLYYCGQLVTNAILTRLEEGDDYCLELKVEDIYD